MLFDSHAHLLEASVQEISSLHYPVLNVTTDVSQWSAAITLSKSYPNLLCALGLHPWFVTDGSFADIVLLENYLQREKVTAIGEIGLDFQKSYLANKNLQLEIFEWQLQLADRYNKPVSVHVVKAHNEMLALLKKYSIKGVIHGLGSSLRQVEQYLNLGLKVGVNGVLCRFNARRYHAMIESFDLSHFVLETDYPNITLPQKSVASLTDISSVASMIAELKGCSQQEVERLTGYNAQQVFNFCSNSKL